ncbi:hypothetical protein NA57DRAFT_76833 [Rhizodiscina lignyota]|uniref:Uncharacterized protein n=1 Tax=Rhizodiscina lignyota TaxID=1504668 RepID=A0A9P4M4S7_9PEZI|nr:hypothetical protein NA57DRAFT_76833 [Rhizodiscina lignyota]
MSDSARKGLGEQAQEKVTPDSQKSTFEQAKEGVTGTADRAAGAAQPDDQKSTTQKMGDSVRGTSDDTSEQSKSYVQSAQEGLSGAAQSVKDTFSGDKK